MGTITDLAVLVKELEDQLAVCTQCGTCQSVCPLFEQTGREADVARGKLMLLDGLISHIFSSPDGVNQRLNRCLLCGSCAANCPSSVNIIEIFIRARVILTRYKGLSIFKQIIFKQMLANPKTFNTLLKWAAQFQNLIIKGNQNEQGTSCARFMSPLLMERHFLPMARRPFHEQIKQTGSSTGTSDIRVLFFTGCLIDKILPNIAMASVKALTHHKVELIIPEAQGCCGIPALSSGDQESFNGLVEYHIDLFRKEKFDYLVTACATCTSTIKKLWPTLYQGRIKDKKNTALHAFLKKLADRTMDLNAFLTDVVQVSPPADSPTLPPKEPVTYHDPCHLKKSLGISVQPRTLIKTAGHPLHEMNDPDKCCGMGGSFNLLHYDISRQIGNLKQKQIIATHCSIVSSGCPACIMQISDMLSKSGSNIRVKHPIELYADSLDG